jgi:hypothetical protein
VPITTTVVSSVIVHVEVYLIQHYAIKFFNDIARQGLSGPYQMSSAKSESDMDLIILVERKTILINFFIGSFTILTQLYAIFVVFCPFV